MTSHDWILNVLADLQDYADRNGLPALSMQAGEARRVAVAEIAMLDPSRAALVQEGLTIPPSFGRTH